jgi:N-formylglutamate amidohydrolase
LRVVDDFVAEPAFDRLMPSEIRAPIVFDAPHSGCDYPADFLAESRLDGLAIRMSEDAHVDALFSPCVAAGMPMLRARFPRAFLDVNREPYELDPRMFEGRLPIGANTRSPRVACGLGTIPRMVSETDEIYRGRIPIGEALVRIERIYRPYHAALDAMLGGIGERFGRAILIDCHSMPSGPRGGVEAQVDIVLGDRHGTSCHPALTDVVSSLFRAAGYRVARNRPYAGGFITERHGRPASGRHALQIEIARGLYMNERTLEPNGGFSVLACDIQSIIGELARSWRFVFSDDALAAE